MVRSPVLLALVSLIISGSVDGKVYHRTQKTCAPTSTSVNPFTQTKTATRTATIIKHTSTGKVPPSSRIGSATVSDNGPEETGIYIPPGDIRVNQLFPVAVKSSALSWSTSNIVDNNLPLSDSTLKVSRVTRGTSHPVVKSPDGKTAMQAFFPKGSVEPGDTPYGGFSFYAYGPIDLTKGTEILFSYSVYFEPGFQFNMGGKLPGLYGGSSDGVAVSCSGGRKDNNCFSLRLMWRTGGEAELYAYLPPGEPANEKICHGSCPYGASVGRGKFKWQTGKWNTIAERVKLNDVGKANGEVEIYYGGKSVILLTGVVIRTSENSLVRGLQMQTFFGGHTRIWGSPKDQSAYFADFSAAVIA
ncbi:hypothetical protein FRC02_011647 [Tulasnella sp. 418]|nr:hypothetical protein FRC02_011647 [Tulasnella sp. 418]